MGGTSWERQADRLADRALAEGEPTAWFERLYAGADTGANPLPWDTEEPRTALVEWAEREGIRGDGKRAIVVGCGLGQNSEYIAGLGFDTVAFDIASTAIRVVRERYPHSSVEYLAADLLDLPPEWEHAFDLVVEVYTVQALPDPPRGRAIANVARLVGDGGTLIVVAAARRDSEPAPAGPPWPLTRREVDAFAGDGLAVVRVEEGDRQWRAEFRRVASG
jgi:SAM-dependent methyltransferase